MLMDNYAGNACHKPLDNGKAGNGMHGERLKTEQWRQVKKQRCQNDAAADSEQSGKKAADNTEKSDKQVDTHKNRSP